MSIDSCPSWIRSLPDQNAQKAKNITFWRLESIRTFGLAAAEVYWEQHEQSKKQLENHHGHNPLLYIAWTRKRADGVGRWWLCNSQVDVSGSREALSSTWLKYMQEPKLSQPSHISIYKRIGVCPSVRPISYWLENSVSGKITQCDGYHSVSGLFVRKTGSLCAMGKLLGGLWELSVRGKVTQGIGITQCNGYHLVSGCH